jgi:putative Mg2+ transporter-C (MgtC) family protein
MIEEAGMIDTWEILQRLVLAAVLGAVIGADRERREWAAGLRTHMLVCVGAALAIIVSAYGFGEALKNPQVVLDPSRVAAQVVSGIGFLGAGTILFMQREQVVRGLTTAAGLWAVASIGLAAGAGLYAAAAMTTALIWIILVLLKPLQRRLFARHNLRPRLRLSLADHAAVAGVEAVVAAQRLPLFKLILNCRKDADDQLILIFERGVEGARMTVLADALRALEGVTAIQLGATVRGAACGR